MKDELSPIVARMKELCSAYAAGAVHAEFTPFYRVDGVPAEDATAGFIYQNFEIAFLYHSRIGRTKSVLECRLHLLAGHDRIDFSLYDILYLLDENDYNCYIFPNIESPDRMQACLSYLMQTIDRYRPQLEAIGGEEQVVARAQALRRKEMERFFKQDIFDEHGDALPDQILDWRLRSYREWYVRRFCSEWYACYARGDYEKAAKKFAGYDNKSNYELRLYRFLKTLGAGAIYEPATPACNTYVGKRTSRSARVTLWYALCALGSTALFAVLYAVFAVGVRIMLYHGALLTTPLLTRLSLAIYAICSAASGGVCAYFVYRRIMPRALRDALAQEAGITGTHTDRAIMRSTARFVTVAALIVLTLTAKSGLAYYPDGIKNNLTLAPATIALYSDVTGIYRVEQTGGYYLCFADKTCCLCPEDILNERVLPRTEIEVEQIPDLQALTDRLGKT